MREYIDYNDTLREGTDKLNKAIDRAYDADETAAQAKQDVDDTLVTVNDTLDDVNAVKDTAATLLDEVNTTNQQVITLADEVQTATDELAQAVPVGEYNAGTTYHKNNEVSYNGSSYVAKQETQGNPPTNTTYWQLRAQRGVDGEGSVSSVNGVFPDLDGNVEVDIPDISGLATKVEVQAVEGELVAHKAEKATLTKEGHVQLSNAIDSESETLASTPKAVKQVYDLAQSAFTSASNGKELVGNAITGVDDSVVIPTEPTFQDLATAIGSISTGKKWASGKVNLTGSSVTVTGLEFNPSYAIAFIAEGQHTYMAANFQGVTSLFSSRFGNTYIANSSLTLRTDGIAIVSDYKGEYDWIAFE